MRTLDSSERANMLAVDGGKASIRDGDAPGDGRVLNGGGGRCRGAEFKDRDIWHVSKNFGGAAPGRTKEKVELPICAGGRVNTGKTAPTFWPSRPTTGRNFPGKLQDSRLRRITEKLRLRLLCPRRQFAVQHGDACFRELTQSRLLPLTHRQHGAEQALVSLASFPAGC